MKIFCIGLNKTGTTALMIGLQRMGYKVCDGLNGDWKNAKTKEDMRETAMSKIKDFDAFEDLPWGLYYQELYAKYPDAKFIYSYREVNQWWKSFFNHFKEQDIAHHKTVYGYANPSTSEAEHKAFYLKHQEKVRHFFSDKQHCFLELDFSNKADSAINYEKFSLFLGKKYKAGDKFPVANSKMDRVFWNHLRRVKRKLGF